MDQYSVRRIYGGWWHENKTGERFPQLTTDFERCLIFMGLALHIIIYVRSMYVLRVLQRIRCARYIIIIVR